MKHTRSEIEAELLRLAEENDGVLKPEAVVGAARHPDSPLHSQFTWDDSQAAEQYRLWQARQLIRVVVQLIPSAHGEVSERVFVSLHMDREQAGGGYRKLIAVMSNEQMRRALLEEALEEMERFQEKYARLKELAGVLAEMKKARTRARAKKPVAQMA